MTVAFRAFSGKVAIWELPLVGDIMAPFDDPVANFPLVRFHSDCQYLSNQIVSSVITKNHTLLAGVTGTGYSVSNGGSSSSGTSTPVANGQVRVTAIELYTHSLGYAPLFMVMYNGRIVSPGTVIQNPDGQLRMASAYATTSKIFLEEIAISSVDDLPAVDRDYQVIIFREPAADPLLPTLQISVASGMILGRGKVTDEQRPLRRSGGAGDATFYIPNDRTIDIKNGAIRSIAPISGAIDLGNYTGAFGSTTALRVTY